MSRRLSRECREYERRWRDTCVDRNLEDEWLERLNDLGALALVGICEGHPDRRAGSSGRYPHITLRLKESLLPGIAGRWGELRVAMLNEIGRLFESGDTDARLELKFRLRAGRGKLVYQEDLTIRLRSVQTRDAGEMDGEAYRWFERSVERVEEIDRVVLAWLGGRLAA
jgi:hypothetical protein